MWNSASARVNLPSASVFPTRTLAPDLDVITSSATKQFPPMLFLHTHSAATTFTVGGCSRFTTCGVNHATLYTLYIPNYYYYASAKTISSFSDLHKSNASGSPALVPGHAPHPAVGLDVGAASVISDTLADEEQRLRDAGGIARLVREVNDPAGVTLHQRGRAIDHREQRILLLQQLRIGDHLHGDASAAEQLLHVLVDSRRCHPLGISSAFWIENFFYFYFFKCSWWVKNFVDWLRLYPQSFTELRMCVYYEN